MGNLTLDANLFLKHLKTITTSEQFLIAYSGGLDSHVLLHLIAKFENISIRAVHIHHGLQAIADSWVSHCQETCDQLHIPLDVIHLNLHPEKGESVEQVARIGRYKALENILQKNEVLLTAQHQDDQTETLLLQLFRGAGVQGLASMPIICNFGKGKHARPLLNTSKQEIEIYAKNNELRYIEDPSNQDTSFDRNFLRKDVLPVLRQRWLGLDKAINRSAEIQAETKQILDEIAHDDLKPLLLKENILSINNLSKFSVNRQRLLLRYWITQCGFQAPSKKKLSHLFSDVIQAQKDANPLIEWQNIQIRRYQNNLYIMQKLSQHDASQTIIWKPTASIKIDSLNIILKPDILYQKKQTVTVRFRQGGEKIFIPNKNKWVSLKTILSEAKIPPWERSRMPLIYSGDELIQIIGIKTK